MAKRPDPTNTERQRRYRQRARESLAEADALRTKLAEALAAKAVDLSAIRAAVDELYDARAKPSEWRIRLRAEIGKLGG